MVRITVKDPEKIVSFLGDFDTARALVAACAAEPQLLEDLLVAAEPYRTGTAARVMAALIRADVALEVGHAVPLFEALEVTDEATLNLALRTGDDLIIIDLAEQTVHGYIDGDHELSVRGVARSEHLAPDLERETVYALSPRWRVSVESRTGSQAESVRYA